MPNLIELQKSSYDKFLQRDIDPMQRKNEGLQAVLNSVFPIRDFTDIAQLEFVRYHFEEPKFDVEESLQRGATYAAPLRVMLRLVVWDVDAETGRRSIRDIKEQDVYMGDIPLMTPKGTFIINGSERVIVSQMHRAPGVFFDHDAGKTHASGKLLYRARIMPNRGSWLDFEFDPRDILYVRIDRRRKLPATTFLMALESFISEKARLAAEAKGETVSLESRRGIAREEILGYFYEIIEAKQSKKGWKVPFDPQTLRGTTLIHDLIDAKGGEVILPAGTKVTPRVVHQLKEKKIDATLVPASDLIGRYIARNLVDKATGEVLAEAGDPLTQALFDKLQAAGVATVPLLAIDGRQVSSSVRDTLALDKNTTYSEALFDIYRVLRPGEPPTLESAEALFRGLFFDADRYDLSPVGRVKMNERLGLDVPVTTGTLLRDDVLAILKALVELKDGRGEIDDIDHLGNRRVRSVGELLENQMRVGLVRMERAVRERMGSTDLATAMPHDLLNAKPLMTAVREFFGSSQLSQFMDQTNPLSEITHKRRLSALGPGGLTRDRASFEVRDVHTTHYGRICPIETPEGPNVGLINSLATYARVNPYGFIESPYRRVIKSRVTNEVVYLSATEEGRHTIAEANAAVDAKGNLIGEVVSCRRRGEFMNLPPAEIDFIDVSPKQMVSVAASLIPFLENDDANRALMGSNMQRQAVPLIKTDAPLVGTGMEAPVARDSGATVVARRGGMVEQMDAQRIVVRAVDEATKKTCGVDIYNLSKFQRSNQDTCVNQKPLVAVGDTVVKGEVIADGPATQLGELALGRNVLVAFMPWLGYNFEDSIIISEKLVSGDAFTSIHIDEYEVMARDTKLGDEEITRDIPNVGEEGLRNLDEAGIVYIGAEVQPGDILVGKVTPKGETPMTPEEKLLRAIFGEKASDVRDTSLRLPPGGSGTIVDVRVFSRRGIEKDERALAIEQQEVSRLTKDRDAEKRILERSFWDQIKDALMGYTVQKGPKGLKAGSVLTEASLKDVPQSAWRQIEVTDEAAMAHVGVLLSELDERLKKLQDRFEDKVDKVRRGDDLPTGVLKMVKVYVAVKRKLQPGDKMAGRHGNKGVVSKIVPVQDMPYLEDGRPVDVILNPLGLPSRMNVGQILETHLGWAAAGLGRQVNEMLQEYRSSTPSAQAKNMRKYLKDIYDDPQNEAQLAKMSDAEVMDLAHNVRSGVPMATPVFDGASEADIVAELEKAKLSSSGQIRLIDGRTGEYFEREITVGYIYILKLHHLVDDKIHARSVGPYSLVTQQPLGGKAQFGGQRFGEMEVWALEAYGAAYTLQEMLTVKSDDVAGRTKVYEAIVRGDSTLEAGIPESFNVLVKELRSLGLDMEFLENSAP